MERYPNSNTSDGRRSDRTSQLRGAGTLCVWFGCAIAFGMGCNAEPVNDSVAEYVLGPPQVLVSAPSGLLARPRAIALDSFGNLYILDQIDRQVIAIDPEGKVRHTIAGPGPGPGELTHPLFLGVDDGRVRVFDYDRAAVKIFSTAGEYLQESPTGIVGLPNRVSFGPGGRLAYSGAHLPDSGALVAVKDGLRTEPLYLGQLVSEDTDVPARLLDEVHERSLPGFMRNNALPVFLPDGTLWVFLQTEAILQRFGPNNGLQTERKITFQRMDRIRRDFFDWYARVGAADLVRYFEYVEAGVVVNGALWLLWNMPRDRPAFVTVHDDTGAVTAQLTLDGTQTEEPPWIEGPPRRRFAVDPARLRLYLMEQHGVSVSWFAIPPHLIAEGGETQ